MLKELVLVFGDNFHFKYLLRQAKKFESGWLPNPYSKFWYESWTWGVAIKKKKGKYIDEFLRDIIYDYDQ